MSDDAAMQAIRALAGSMQNLQRQAAQLYLPVVEDILRTRSRDTQYIEQTLDGLLNFCGHESVLQLYKQLCRHYWNIDPAATADYINAYREYWDSDTQKGQSQLPDTEAAPENVKPDATANNYAGEEA